MGTKRYVVSVPELWARTYHIEAESLEEAKDKLERDARGQYAEGVTFGGLEYVSPTDNIPTLWWDEDGLAL